MLIFVPKTKETCNSVILGITVLYISEACCVEWHRAMIFAGHHTN